MLDIVALPHSDLIGMWRQCLLYIHSQCHTYHNAFLSLLVLLELIGCWGDSLQSLINTGGEMTAISLWSSVMIAISLSGYPLFPGEDEGDQLACIIEVLGMPPSSLLEISKRTRVFFTSRGFPRYCVMETDHNGQCSLKPGKSRRGKIRGLPGSRDLQAALKLLEEKSMDNNEYDSKLDFLDFVKSCLTWNAEDRLMPREALRHSWLRRRLPRPM